MRGIYPPTGGAKEYCKNAVNLYMGCNHGCDYCYARKMHERYHKTPFEDVQPREGILEVIKKQAPRYSGQEVFIMFMGDPYPEIESELGLTRQAIRILHENGVIVRILTKAGKRSEEDFDLLQEHPELSRYGVTLTSLPHASYSTYEPRAASTTERQISLFEAHQLGIPTYVSLEPVLNPVDTLGLIELTQAYVDEYWIGKLNHNTRLEAQIDKDYGWTRFIREAIELLEKLGKTYYIKSSLRRYLSQ